MIKILYLNVHLRAQINSQWEGGGGHLAPSPLLQGQVHIHQCPTKLTFTFTLISPTHISGLNHFSKVPQLGMTSEVKVKQFV